MYISGIIHAGLCYTIPLIIPSGLKASDSSANIFKSKDKKYQDAVCRVDRRAKAVWANTDLQMESLYKPGGVGIISFQSVAGQIKESGFDRKGRWASRDDSEGFSLRF